MFKVTPDKVKVIFIVREDLRDIFLDQIYSTGATWFRYQFEKLVDHLETKDCLLLDSKNEHLDRLFKRLEEPAYVGKFIYLVGANEFLDRINFTGHFVFNKSDDWSEFNTWYKRINEHTFDSLLKLTNEIHS